MDHPIYELLLWNSCNNNCYFCWQKARKDKFPEKFVKVEDTLRPIELAKSFVDFVSQNTPNASMLFMGGELFDRKLPKKSENAFLDLASFCYKKMKNNRLYQIYFNTNLIYTDTDLLFSILDKFKDLQERVQLTTSYDFGYRYATASDLWTVVKNMKAISTRYPKMKRVANCIITRIARNVLFLDPLLPKTFQGDSGFLLNPIPYIKLHEVIAITRNQIYELLVKLEKYNPGIIQRLVDGVCNSEPKVLYEYNGEEYIRANAEDAECGHNVNFRNIYKDSDRCFACDMINFVKSIEV